ncbi:DUF2125 domain-containing protein [Profundibacter sp.]
MRKLLAIIVILSGLWGGYWFVGSTALKTGLEDYLSRNHGARDPVRISYSGLGVRGFPNRFDTRLTDISITDAASNISWSAPFFQIHALSYKPYHIIAALPHSQTLRLQGQQLQIMSDEIKGSVVFAADALLDKALMVERSRFVLRNLGVTSDMGWKTAIAEASIASRQAPADALHYDLAATATAIALPEALRGLIDPARLQSGRFDSLSLDSTLAFTQPWNLLARGANVPQLTEITVNDLTLIWGDVQFQATGRLQIDQSGMPNGRLDLTATNWQKIYQLAENANAVDPDSAQTIRRTLMVLAGMSTRDNVINAPLNFTNGQMLLGPLPIGPAPRF